jgi:hypothetical protein
MRKLAIVPTAASSAEGLPDDPRARRVLRQLREKPVIRIPGGRLGPVRSKPAEQSDWLYWILRIAQPERVLVTGCPAADGLITLAAAVADGGGRRVVCLEDPERSPGARIQGLVAGAGLDWLLRFDRLDSEPGFIPDALVLAGSDPVWITRTVERLGLADGPKLVIGLGRRLGASGKPGAAMRDRLSERGYRLLMPEAMPTSIWAMLSRNGKG